MAGIMRLGVLAALAATTTANYAASRTGLVHGVDANACSSFAHQLSSEERRIHNTAALASAFNMSFDLVPMPDRDGRSCAATDTTSSLRGVTPGSPNSRVLLQPYTKPETSDNSDQSASTAPPGPAAASADSSSHQQRSDGEWHSARATFYGLDLWSIHQGSCRYGYLDEDVGTGWDVAAMADHNDGFSSSCGRCVEVRCEPATFADGFGEVLNRQSACLDAASSLVVQVTDSCECNYGPNAFSNKRWCCGDMQHMDLSVWAFEKLASLHLGVIGIKMRSVTCAHAPAKRAMLESGVSPRPESRGLRHSPDRRPGWGR